MQTSLGCTPADSVPCLFETYALQKCSVPVGQELTYKDMNTQEIGTKSVNDSKDTVKGNVK